MRALNLGDGDAYIYVRQRKRTGNKRRRNGTLTKMHSLTYRKYVGRVTNVSMN